LDSVSAAEPASPAGGKRLCTPAIIGSLWAAVKELGLMRQGDRPGGIPPSLPLRSDQRRNPFPCALSAQAESGGGTWASRGEPADKRIGPEFVETRD